jgi:hypothetical protein
MLLVRLIEDPFNLDAYSEHQPAELLPFLKERFETWPETARLYKDAIAVDHDVTPRTEADIAALETAQDGTFYVVVYPGDPVTAIIAVVATLALTVAVLLFLTPKFPNSASSDQSSNNALGQRVNKARPNSRIEDIFGEVISVPTLLTVPLLVFDDNLEVEYCYMCVGRGAYTIADVKDGDTPIGQIAGAGVRFYAPGTSPNSGAPFYSIGAPINVPLYNVVKLNEVNGQSLRPPNANAVRGDGDIRFVAPDRIERSGTEIDFTKYFETGDVITVTGADFGGEYYQFDATSQNCRFYPDYRIEFETFDPSTQYQAGDTIVITNASFVGTNPTDNSTVYVDLSGTYTVESVTSTEIQLVEP